MSGKKLEEVVQSMDVEIDPDLLQGTPQDILNRARMIDGQTKILDSEINAINSEIKGMKERLKENAEKIKMHKQLPYLVGHVVEVRIIDLSSLVLFAHSQILDLGLATDGEEEEEGANVDLDSKRKGKSVVIKTSTRQVCANMRFLSMRIAICDCVSLSRRCSCQWWVWWILKNCSRET